MARVPSKHGRDQSLDFQGFLNDLQDWELSLKEKDKKMKPQTPDKEKSVSSSQKIGIVGEDRRPIGKTPTVDHSRNNAGQYDYSRNYDAISRISSSFMNEESTPDAASEKELGNEYFKQKKFKEAIDCYSRSIALSPTAVAYANRAMAYIKIRRFQDAEDDCSEALNLDDRYIKAYSRRAMARKELGKLKESIEDSEFALRLEPHNQEIKKQHAEAKSLYEKEILQRASGALRSPVQGVQKVGKSKMEVNGDVQEISSVSSSSQKTGVTAIEEDHPKVAEKNITPVEEIESKSMRSGNRIKGQVDSSHEDTIRSSSLESVKKNHRIGKQELKTSVQELASRAASRAMVEASKNTTPPNSAYQFEVSWRGLSGDPGLQARFLKAISPNALPQIFKNALSAPILTDIIKCVATFFTDDMDLAVKYLENLTKVSRFDMIIMCLSSQDRADILKIWDEVFCNKAVPIEYAEVLDKLHSRYCPKR
ncbi:hypothetical protein L1049_020905 [Liquidambar formosana]|uniref:RNA-polymerase II-associated protein 3-like C-terminal domain-containing protein n=1 Tax=Liquidambar formosana TaxID=63359 RepID=A0AAP0SEL8_LIQFO